jgi:hypothetical protein
MSAPTARDETAIAASLRAEHDDLARRLEIRPSIDELRRGLLRLFAGLIATGLTVKLGWDRWGVLKPGIVRRLHRGPPLFLWIATTVALVLLVLSIRALVRARRLGREEDRLFARYRQLRAELGTDA